jgi:GAF domain-containing protein
MKEGLAGPYPPEFGSPGAADAAGGEDCYVFRVGGRSGRLPQDDRAYGEWKTAAAAKELELELAKTHGFNNRLRVILQRCIKQLGFRAGYIARAVLPDGHWLEVAACEPPEMDGLLRFLPARAGVHEELLAGGSASDAHTVTATGPQVQARLDPVLQGVPQESYPLEDRRKFGELIERMHVWVGIALKRGAEAVGLLCLYRDTPGPVDAVDRAVVEKLAQRAAVELANQRACEERYRQGNPVAQAAALARQVEARPLHERIHRFAHELARQARLVSGAVRTAVRWLGHDDQGLAVLGHDGLWPRDFLDRFHPRCPGTGGASAPEAYNRALDANASIRIADTRRLDVPYEVVAPAAAAQLSIVLRGGIRPRGVLSVDFDPEHSSACNEEMTKLLEDLAVPFASYLDAYVTDQLSADLDAWLPWKEPGDGKSLEGERESLKKWLETAARAVGAQSAALFLRDADTGGFRLQTWLHVGPQPAGEVVYEPGEGRTGWVALYGKPLNLADCENPIGLDPPPRPSQQPECWDRDTERLAFLGVPILVGQDVVGVLRFELRTPKQPTAVPPRTCFSKMDEQLALAAAARLGPWLYEQQQMRRNRALAGLVRAVFGAASQEALAQVICFTLEQGVGACGCVIRLVDCRDKGDGRAEEVLDRRFTTDANPDHWPQYRTLAEEGAARVWGERKKWVIRDMRTDELVADLRKRALRGEGWLEEWGCGVVAPLLADGNVVVGTLAVLRKARLVLQEEDVRFVDKVTEYAGLAFRRLVEAEEQQIRFNLIWAVAHYLEERHGAEASADSARWLLQAITRTLTVGLGAAVGCCWSYDPAARTLRGLPPADGAAAPRDLPWEEVEQQLGRSGFVVVSEPATDERLRSLLPALPGTAAEAYRDCQQAAILLARAQRLEFLAPALFVFVVQPPRRLSYTRVQSMVRMLVEALSRHPLGPDGGVPIE